MQSFSILGNNRNYPPRAKRRCSASASVQSPEGDFALGDEMSDYKWQCGCDIHPDDLRNLGRGKARIKRIETLARQKCWRCANKYYETFAAKLSHAHRDASGQLICEPAGVEQRKACVERLMAKRQSTIYSIRL